MFNNPYFKFTSSLLAFIAFMSLLSYKNNSSSQDSLSVSEAKHIIMDNFPGGTITKFAFDFENDYDAYKAELLKNGILYKLYISATNPKAIIVEETKFIYSASTDTDLDIFDENIKNKSALKYSLFSDNDDTDNSPALLNSDYIRYIMQNKAPNAIFESFYLNDDLDVPLYEGILLDDKKEYTIHINAYTGEVELFKSTYIY